MVNGNNVVFPCVSLMKTSCSKLWQVRDDLLGLRMSDPKLKNLYKSWGWQRRRVVFHVDDHPDLPEPLEGIDGTDCLWSAWSWTTYSPGPWPCPPGQYRPAQLCAQWTPPHVLCAVLLVLLTGLLGAWDDIWRFHVSLLARRRLPNISG